MKTQTLNDYLLELVQEASEELLKYILQSQVGKPSK